MAGRVASMLVVAVFLLVQVWAEEQEKCCWISQMYGKTEILGNEELEDGTIVLEKTDAEFAYDRTFGLKSFIFTETFDNGTQRIGRIVELSDLGVSYNIEDNQGEQTCSRKPIPFRFKLNCIPESAQFSANVTLGDHALNGHVWDRNNLKDGRLVNTSYLMVADHCVPVTLRHVVYNFNTDPPEVQLIDYAYADIRLGICDRDKFFHVPDECPQDALTPFMEKKLKERHMMEMPFSDDM